MGNASEAQQHPSASHLPLLLREHPIHRITTHQLLGLLEAQFRNHADLLDDLDLGRRIETL